MLTGLSLRRRVEEVERENLVEHDVSIMTLPSVVQDEISPIPGPAAATTSMTTQTEHEAITAHRIGENNTA